ncbi:hypothetical protein H920_11298 [Fukomys damarensis]|uniref:Uncharacterized protein n=1 Tax=Fukomys damarensis TaxID=885580 RepID=A0A091DA08_FUKDA|nr:hypothetical protein H920_11298 [Fukomys damarensis]
MVIRQQRGIIDREYREESIAYVRSLPRSNLRCTIVTVAQTASRLSEVAMLTERKTLRSDGGGGHLAYSLPLGRNHVSRQHERETQSRRSWDSAHLWIPSAPPSPAWQRLTDLSSSPRHPLSALTHELSRSTASLIRISRPVCNTEEVHDQFLTRSCSASLGAPKNDSAREPPGMELVAKRHNIRESPVTRAVSWSAVLPLESTGPQDAETASAPAASSARLARTPRGLAQTGPR